MTHTHAPTHTHTHTLRALLLPILFAPSRWQHSAASSPLREGGFGELGGRGTLCWTVRVCSLPQLRLREGGETTTL